MQILETPSKENNTISFSVLLWQSHYYDTVVTMRNIIVLYFNQTI